MTLSLQEMSDRFEIQDLLVGYCYAVDDKDFDALSTALRGKYVGKSSLMIITAFVESSCNFPV